MTTDRAESPRRRRSTARSAKLTGRGLALVVVGVVSLIGAYSGGRSELLYLGLLLVLLPTLAMLFARFRRIGISASRSFTPSIVAIGQPTTVELTVTNLSPMATPELIWRDYRPWSAGSNMPGILPSLAAKRTRGFEPRSSTRLRYELIASRRGIYDIGPMNVVIADPFGLARGEVTVSGTDSLVVTPKIAMLADNGLAIQASDGASMLVRRAVGGEDDLSTREYRTGDALRRVHWRATARHGELMVRQEEPRSHAEARIILDTRLSGYDDSLDGRHFVSESFELALSLAASLALHLARTGFQAEIVETATAQLAPVAPIEPFLRTIATIGLSDEEGEFASGSALAGSARPDRASGSVFAIVAEPDRDTVDRLIAQRPSFDLAVAFVIDWRVSAAAEYLEKSGWTVLPVRVDDTAESIWDAIAAMQGARFGR